MNKFKSMNKKSRLLWLLALFFAVLWLVIAIFPFIFMVLNSFKEQFEILKKGVFSWPETFYLDNYVTVLTNGIGKYFLNSVIVCAVSLILSLLLAAFAAYPLSRFRLKINGAMMLLIVACMSIPIHITLIPIFKMTTDTALYDTIWGLIGPNVAFELPISIFILVGFMKGIPPELEAAAKIDGCSTYRMFFKIIFPLAKPGLATLAIYDGVDIWNGFIFSYTLTQSPESRTLPLAIWDFQGMHSMNAPMIMAVLTITLLPMLILFLIFQDKLIEGMTVGAVKG